MKIFIISKDLEFANNLTSWLDLNSENYVILSDLKKIVAPDDKPSILLYDSSSFSSNLSSTSEEIFSIPDFKMPTVVFVNENSYLGDHASIQYFLNLPHIQHFVAKDEESVKLLLYPIKQKVLNPFVLGIERYFPVDSINSLNVKKYFEKQNCFALVEQTLSQSRHFKALKDYSMTVTSELLMNSFFDAPIDKKTNIPLFMKVSREENIELPDNHVNTFSCALSPKWFAISMTDSFGSLNRASVTKSLKRTLQNTGENQFRSLNSNEGAGVGLYLLYNCVCNIVFKVIPFQKTEVICFLKITQKQKDYENNPKSIQYLERNSL